MKTLEQIKARHEREITEAIQKEQIADSLPVYSDRICIHSDHASVTYAKSFPERYSFREALAIFAQFKPVECEHWKDGCLSIRPAEINSSAKNERAVMDGASIAEIRISAGRGYDSHELKFWARVDGRLLQISIEINPPYKWLPDVKFTYNQSGECLTKYCHPAFIGEDQRVKWWSPDGSYQISYYWADLPNFEAFASQQP